MNKAVPWNIKGIDSDTREAAREAARRSGMSVGEWLNSVIADQAAAAGVEVEDLDEDDWRDAVSARLSRRAPRARRDDRDDDEGPSRRRPAIRPRDDRGDAEDALSGALRSFERKSRRQGEQTVEAISNVARRLEDIETRLRGESDAAPRRAASERPPREDREIARRLDELETRLSNARAERSRERDREALRRADPADERDSDEKLNDALRAFGRGARSRDGERRAPATRDFEKPDDHRNGDRDDHDFGARRAQSASAENSLRELERKIAAMNERIETKTRPEPEPAPAADSPSDLKRIEDKLNRLLEGGSKPAMPPPFANPARPAGGVMQHAYASAPRATLADAIAQITRRQRALEGTAATAARRAQPAPRFDVAPAAAPPSPEVAGLLKEVSSLSSRLDDLRRDREMSSSPLAGRESVGMDPRFDHVALALKDVPSRSSLAAVETAVQDLGRRIDSTLRSGPGVEHLERQFDELARSLKDLPPRGALSSIETALHDVSRKVDATRHELAPATDHLTRQIEDMSRALKDVAPRSALANIEMAVRDLAQRIDFSRQGGMSESVLRPLETLVGEVKRALAENSPREGLERLEHEFQALVARVDGKRGPAIETGLRAEIQAQTDSIRAMIANISTGPIALDGLEKQIAGLNARMELLALRGATGEDRAGVEKSVAEIRRSLDANPGTRVMKQLELRIDALARKIDDAVAQSDASEQFDSLARRLDLMQKTLTDRATPPMAEKDARALERMMGEIAGKLDRPGGADTRRLEDLVQSLSDKLAHAGAPQADMRLVEALQGQIARLSDKLDMAGPSGAGDNRAFELMSSELQRFVQRFERGQAGVNPEALEQLQQQMAMLVERIDRDDGAAQSLVSMETAIGELFGRIDEIKHVAVEAAENAARASLAQAMDHQGGGAPNPGLARELADLRQAQDRSDSRNHATLTAVHETLEKVVDRLALLEDDLADAKPASAKSASTLASGPAPTFARVNAEPPAPQRAPAQDEPAPQRARAPAPIPDEADELIEPGAGRPSGRRAEPDFDQPTPQRVQTATIAAARRAIQANAAAAAAEPPPKSGAKSRAASMLESLTGGRDKAKAAHMAAAAAAAANDPGAPAPEAANGGKLAKVKGIVARRKFFVILVVGLIAAAGALAALPMLRGGPKRAEVINLTKVTPPPQRSPAAASPDQQNLALAPADLSTTSKFAAPNSAAPPPTDPAPVATINPRSSTTNLRDAANGGDARAQYELGNRYFEGRAMPRDPKLSTQWFEKAALQNSAPAQYRLGSHYERGVGVEKDVKKAREWYQRAAEAGNVRAMHNLAVLSAEGSDGKPDYAAAASWFRKAAEYGVRDSQYNLAILYARGLGIEQNLQQSWMWFSLANAQGDEDAGKKRDDVAQRLDAKGLAAAKSQYEGFKPRLPDKTSNEVPSPPGGWDTSEPRPAASTAPAPSKAPTKGKVTSL